MKKAPAVFDMAGKQYKWLLYQAFVQDKNA